MKRILYIVYVLVLLVSTQSCDLAHSLFGDNSTQQKEQTNVHSEDSVSQNVSANAIEIQSQLLQRDSAIKVLTDSLNNMVSNISALRADIKGLIQKQEKLENEKVAQAVVENTNVQRGESGIPSWLKFVCMVLFIITCVFILVAGMVSINTMHSMKQQNQPAMYNSVINSDNYPADSTAMDSID